MQRYSSFILAGVLLAAVLGVGISLHYRISQLEQRIDRPAARAPAAVVSNETERLNELRTRRLELDLYRKQIEAGIRPQGPQPHLSSSDLAELAELERRAAERAADRAGSR